MSCVYSEICGGCSFRHLTLEQYRQEKFAAFQAIINKIKQPEISFAAPIFIADQSRRRASLAFRSAKGKLVLGFNERQSKNIVDLQSCSLLTQQLNAFLPALRELLVEICRVPLQASKKKKLAQTHLSEGDVWICEADNGIDLVLEFAAELNLGHSLAIADIANQYPQLIRISHRRSPIEIAEPLLEKIKPQIRIGTYDVFIPAGTFLQPSRAGEQALTGSVLRYLGDSTGRIADLFCGVGTLSYPLAANLNNKITAVDSSSVLLAGFQQSINKNMISNIEILERNLFKYPLDAKELSPFDVLVFDPPRAGASAQTAMVANMPAEQKPQKIIAVSCNPHSFAADANTLISSGYHLEEVTFVDQFAYSNHSELVALFTLKA